MPQAEWEDTVLTMSDSISDKTRVQKDQSWTLEGEMEVKYGKNDGGI